MTFFPHILICFIFVWVWPGLVSIGRANAVENEKFLCAEALFYMPVPPLTGEVTMCEEGCPH